MLEYFNFSSFFKKNGTVQLGMSVLMHRIIKIISLIFDIVSVGIK